MNGFSYLGEDEERPADVRLADHVVMRLMEPYIKNGRNFTTDNFFTSIKLCKDLASKRTSIVGTVNKICHELPNVVLFSTLHPTVTIDNTGKKKPETIEFYNSTKFVVDVLDQMARKYSVKSSSRRWLAQVLFNILDQAVINSWMLYKETTRKNITRRNFIL